MTNPNPPPPDAGMERAVEDYPAIAKRMREIASGEPDHEAPQERKPWCTAIHGGCDWPDCPCGVP